jgi:hypothetical protein
MSGCDFCGDDCVIEPIVGKKKYNVSFCKKKGHKYQDKIEGCTAIHINGCVGPTLKLHRGVVYYFNVCQKKCDGKYNNYFVLTENPVGKIHGEPPEPLKCSFDPVAKGCVKFHVTSYTPKYFYYQNSNAAFQGGLIIVED